MAWAMSIITLAPDLVWRAHGDKAEIAEGEAVCSAFTPQSGGALIACVTLSLRRAFPARRPSADVRQRVRGHRL